MSAQQIGSVSRVLQQIYDEHGEIKPSVLVDVASDEDCEIHEKFTWDDSIAGHQYRLDQARKIIRTTKISYEGRMQTIMHVPVEHISGTGGRPGEGSYKPISSIVRSQSEYERSLAELVAQSVSLKRSIGLLTAAASSEGIEPTVSKDLAKLSRAAAKVEGLINTIALQ